MKQISLLIKPASSNCNLRCSYCFYYDVSEERQQSSYGIMRDEVMEKMLKQVFAEVDPDGSIHFSFQGGEPTVAGLAYFERFVSAVQHYKKNQEITYSIQTNGTLIDDTWAQFFKLHHFLVGISLDGYQKNMDQFRFDAQKKGVYFQVLRGLQALKKYQVEFNLLTVVTHSLAQNPKAVYDYYKSHHYRYIQLIPCLPSLNQANERDKEALTPEDYYTFYSGFFDAWYKDAKQGSIMEVNLFMNLWQMLKGQMPYQCGMIGQCFQQHVVEADGSVYPCDFYVLDEHRIGNFQSDSIQAMHQSESAHLFLHEKAKERMICEACPYRKMCYGGCKRQNICYLKEGYCGYQKFLDECLPRLQSLISRY